MKFIIQVFSISGTKKAEQNRQTRLLLLCTSTSKNDQPTYLILETKGFDTLEEIKVGAAKRWVAAVNADGKYGKWEYAIAKKPTDVVKIISSN